MELKIKSAKKTCLPTGRGFTLLELLIVIAILAVLGAVTIFLLNPAETLKKARDSQRISDLSTIKTALGIYLTSKSSPQLDGTTGTKNDKCIDGGGTKSIWMTDPNITDTQASGTVLTIVKPSSVSAGALTDGTGWIPVNLDSLTGGSPISTFPFDPVNTVVNGASTAAAITNDALIYRYACKSSPLGFEVDTALESSAFTVDDDKRAKDGGNNSNLYEVGTSLTILPSSTDF